MTILCIETSTSVCSAAICKDGALLKQCINYEGSNHARLLPLYMGQLLQYARENGLKVEAIALSEGPGSYTGLRIGTSTAKGLCYGLNVPLIPVPTLDILCLAAKEKLCSVSEQSERSVLCQPEAVLIPMIDARRMEVYTKVQRGDELDTNENRAHAVVVENEESFYSLLPTAFNFQLSTFNFFGDGAAKCTKVFTKPNWHYLPNIVPEARFLAVYAEAILDNNRNPYVDIAYYEPYYLKEFVAAQSHVKGLS